MKKYQFAVDTGIATITAIIIEAPNATEARHDAYTVLQSAFGRCARVKTSATEARVIRKLPAASEPYRHAYTTDDAGQNHQWAWIVYSPAKQVS